jgi:subtilisin family serine protease
MPCWNNAVDQVIRMGNIRIITMSHASLFGMRSWKNAAVKAYNNGIILVAAAGSHTFGKLRSIIVFPAKFKETIATAASTSKNVPWDKTHYGEEVDICAPGFDIYVPSARRQWYGIRSNLYSYKWSEGTSFFTPFTAAAAALWLGHHGEKKLLKKYPEPWQIVEAFRKVLKESARPHKKNIPVDKYGAGLLDVLHLVKMKLPNTKDLKKVSEPSILSGREDKLKHISNKEIIYLLACAKIRDLDREDDTLYEYVYQQASDEAKKLLDTLPVPENLSGVSNPRSEAVKIYSKEFLTSWS